MTTTESDGTRKGRTPDGKPFIVPQTPNMVSQLVSPSQPKNFGDMFIMACVCLHMVLYWVLPTSTSCVTTFATIFLFWRTSYNVGLGYLLFLQTKDRRLVFWAKQSKVFVSPASHPGVNPRPLLYAFLESEMELKVPKNYRFATAPVEFNTWLLFRRLVDLVLMCDFTSYCLFAIACSTSPANETPLGTMLRWSVGWALIIFNVWVKLDAHRVVKDTNWYWGDFFYFVDEELVFDGVYKWTSNPMYGLGYVGYYGISLIAASWEVLFVSAMAHAAQWAFLIFVEDPYFQKTYNSAPAERVEVPQKA